MNTDPRYINEPAGTAFDTDSEIDPLVNETAHVRNHRIDEGYILQPFNIDSFAINSIAWFKND